METTGLLRTIFDGAIWIFVPLILIIVLYTTRVMVGKAEDKAHRKSMNASFWAGFMLFVIVLIYQVGLFITNGFPQNEVYQGFNVQFAVGSGIVAFLLFLAGRRMASQRLTGFTVLLTVAVSCYALVHYLFIRTYNQWILSITLGFTFGYLVHIATAMPVRRRSIKSSKEEGEKEEEGH